MFGIELKKKIKLLNGKNTELTDEISSLRIQNDRLEKTNHDLQYTVSSLKRGIEEVQNANADEGKRLKEYIDKLEAENGTLKSKLTRKRCSKPKSTDE